mgnify:CR=1
VENFVHRVSDQILIRSEKRLVSHNMRLKYRLNRPWNPDTVKTHICKQFCDIGSVLMLKTWDCVECYALEVK